MPLDDVLPKDLLDKTKQPEVIKYLRALPIPARRKKEVLVEWTKEMEVALTNDAVVELLGPLAEEVRG
jgi:hypothetical protein